MLFQHINRHADKHRKRVYLVLVVVIGLSFVVWVTPRGCDGTSRPGAHTKVGKMYGKTITQGDFIKATQQADLGSFLRTGRWIGSDRSNNEELTVVTMRRLMALREAHRLGLDSVSVEEFTSYVKGRPMLQTDEAFDAEKLKTFRENVTRGLRLTGAEFDQVIRDNIAVDRLEAQATSGLVVSPVEIHDAFVQAYEKFTIGYGEVKINATKNGDPAQSELDAYFAAHQQDMRLPDGKILRMASFLIPTDLSKVTIAEKSIEDVYEKQKETSYKGKTLAEVHDAIRNNLAVTEANGKAAEAVRALRDELVAKAPKGEAHEALLQRFNELATKYGAVVADTEPVRATDKTVPGFADLITLAAQSVRLSEGAAVGSPARGTKGVYLPIYVKTIPGTAPETLDQVRGEVVAAVLADKAKILYQEKILPHADEVKGLADENALSGLARKAWDANADKDMEQRRQIYRDTLSQVNRYLKPAFKPEQRTAWIVQFSSADFIDAAAAKIDDQQIEAYYASHLADYQKKEARASQILLKFAPKMDDAAKEKLRARAAALLVSIREQGEPFADVVKANSDDPATRDKAGDMGYAEVGKRAPEIDAALAKLEVGQVSDVVETSTGLVILKLTDRRDGRTVAEVSGEIRGKLEDQEARLLAQDRAADVSDALAAALDEAMKPLGDPDDATRRQVAEKVFTEAAAKDGLEIIKADQPFASNESIGANIGRDYALSRAIFGLDPLLPFSSAISSNARQYVAMLGTINSGRLYDLDKEGAILIPKLSEVARKEIAREAARAEANALRDAWTAAVTAGTVPTTLNGIELKTSKPFSRTEPDYDVPQLGAVYEAAIKAKSGTMLEPIEYDDGFIVARLDARTLPAEDALTAEIVKKHEGELRQAKTEAALAAFYSRLENEANTTLFGEPFPKRKAE